MNLSQKTQECLDYIRQRYQGTPRVGLVLGTGLKRLENALENPLVLEYKDLPHFPVSTVEGHGGRMLLGKLGGQEMVLFSGRWHYYEGFSTREITFPIRVLKALGAQEVILTNASGSVNAQMQEGDLVFVEDHINLLPENPLRGPNEDLLGPRFPDMKNAYHKAWNQKAMDLCRQMGIRAHLGVYVALQGPNLETPAEYRFLHRMGGDLVGMSTVPEVLVAVHAGLKPMVASIVSNRSYPLADIEETSLEKVIATVDGAAEQLSKVIVALLRSL
jgi:purine-nucleoside phosphorylase